MVAGEKTYSVRVWRKEMVAAALPLQEHLLALSNMDLLLPPMDVGVFFCYRFPTSAAASAGFPAMVKNLKASLAKTLVAYYPFAGEVVANRAGEPELLCNNRGVEFVEASADADLTALDFYDADRSVDNKLVPKKEAGVLTVQVTEMKCGGVVLGCTFDHRIADAYSFNMFLVAWSETAAGEEISALPSFRRTILAPRLLPGSQIGSSQWDKLFVPISDLPPPADSHPPIYDNVNRMYYITAADISRLQAAARATKLESFAAYLWKMLGIAGQSGRAKANRTVCHVGVVVDGRSRLDDMKAYFGNVLSMPYGSLGVEEAAGMGVAELAEIVHAFVSRAARGEHFRGLVDWVEERRPEAAVARVCVEEGIPAVVSSGRGFPVGDVEFGWGKAILGSYHFPWPGTAGYVMPMPSVRANGDWVVYAHLQRGVVEVLEADAAGIFRPLSSEYLFVP